MYVTRSDQRFLDLFASLGLIQWVQSPTFHLSGNILDLLLTSDLDRVGDVEVCLPLPVCLH